MLHKHTLGQAYDHPTDYITELQGGTHLEKLPYLGLPQVAADLGGQQDARRRHQLPVVLVEAALQDQLLKVNKGHRYGDRLETALLAHGTDLSLQTGGGTERRTR